MLCQLNVEWMLCGIYNGTRTCFVVVFDISTRFPKISHGVPIKFLKLSNGFPKNYGNIIFNMWFIGVGHNFLSFTMILFYWLGSFNLPIQILHFILLESKYSFSLWLITYIIKKIQLSLNYKIWVLHHLHCLSKISITIQTSFHYLNWTYILKLLVINGREDHNFYPICFTQTCNDKTYKDGN
jgi:multidrug transporter EmrE-like cation transporter